MFIARCMYHILLQSVLYTVLSYCVVADVYDSCMAQ